MKIFFSSSQRAREKYDQYLQKIYKTIRDLRYELIFDTIIKTSTEEFYKQLDAGGHKALVDNYKKSLDCMQKADINVFETSLHSLSIGFLINKSIEFHKPTIVLHLKSCPPYLLNGVVNDKLIIQEYADDTLEQAVKKSLIKAQSLRDKRFNMFMSDELLRYLDDAATKEGVNKSTFIRNLLLEHRKKHEKS